MAAVAFEHFFISAILATTDELQIDPSNFIESALSYVVFGTGYYIIGSHPSMEWVWGVGAAHILHGLGIYFFAWGVSGDEE